MWSKHEKKSDREQYLEDEIERMREDKERQYQEREQARKQQLEEMHQRIEESKRSADSWPEALRKQIYLFDREIATEAKENAKYGLKPDQHNVVDSWFIDGKKACERALEIWREVEKSKAERRAELEKQLAALEDELKNEVAEKLASENSAQGWLEVSRAIREDDPENWLNW